MFELNVDCPNKRVTLIWKAWADKTLTAQEVAGIKAAVLKAWNPTPPLKYHDCVVVMEVEILREADVPVKPTSHDWLTVRPLIGGNPGDETTVGGPGVPTPVPEGTVRTFFSRDAQGNIPGAAAARAVGDALGLPGGPAGAKWDKNGINNAHILRAFSNATYTKADGTKVGWEARADCCKPKAAGGGGDGKTGGGEKSGGGEKPGGGEKKKPKKREKHGRPKKSGKHKGSKKHGKSGKRKKSKKRKSRRRGGRSR